MFSLMISRVTIKEHDQGKVQIEASLSTLCRSVASVLLCILLLALLIMKLSQKESAHHVRTASGVVQSQAEVEKGPDYRIWHVAKEKDQKGFITVVASVNPKHFNREDMSALAARLNKEFANVPKLKVGLVDDENAARLFVTGRLEYPSFEKAERGRYYLDRQKCVEYIQFSTQRGKPRQTIRFKCTRE